MGYGKRFLLDIYTMGKKKVGTLFDSSVIQKGQAQNIQPKAELNGWKDVSFTIPVWTAPGERNWRADLIRNEYLIRTEENGEADWYCVSEPEDKQSGAEAQIFASCPHISTQLRKRNLHLVFDDTNGIGTVRELVERALQGTEWTVGICDTLYEPDGVTEMVRTYTCAEKTGAYNMISGICDKFVCYPVYHGDTLTVDIRARSYKGKMLELRVDKNLVSVSRKRNSEDQVTRLYVEGRYDEVGYVGIEGVNPTGLSFVFNFDYYREIGAFTEQHEMALAEYLQKMSELNRRGSAVNGDLQRKITELSTKWGTMGYAVYPVTDGHYGEPVFGNGAEAGMQDGDMIAKVAADGTYTYDQTGSTTPGANEACAVKFDTPVSGVLGGSEVTAEAKRSTIKSLTDKLREAESDTEKTSLREQISTATSELNALNQKCYDLMEECIQLA